MICVIPLEFLTITSSGYRQGASFLVHHMKQNLNHNMGMVNNSNKDKIIALHSPAFRSEFLSSQNSDLKAGVYI